MTKKNNTYLPIKNAVFWRVKIDYSEAEKRKIASYFPTDHQQKAFEETQDHVSTLISKLRSATPTNIKRKDTIEDIENLTNELHSLYETLNKFLNQSCHPNTTRLNVVFAKLTDKEFPADTSLRTLSDLVLYAKLACKEVSKMPIEKGVKDPHFHRTIIDLVEVCLKYKGPSPARTYNSYKGTRPRNEGKCIEYLLAAIEPIIKKNKLKYEVSIPSIAREVFKARSLMAKNSPK